MSVSPVIYKTTRLGELCTIIGGGTPSKANKSYYSGRIPWATVRDMNTEVLSQTECTISETAVKESATNVIPKGNIVIATRVGLGKVCMLAQNTAINQDLKGIIPKDSNRVDNKYLFHWFKYIADKIVSNGTGATVQGVKIPFIESLGLPLFSLPEQKRIVAILDEAFSGIARAKEIAEKNLANARDIFESYLNGIFDNIPNGWQEKRLCELCEVKHGYAFEGEYFSNEGEYVLLTPGNFFESGGYRDRGVKQKYYIGEIPENFVLKKGDLLVAMTEQAAGLLGSPIIVPESHKFLHNQRLGLIIPKTGATWLNEFFFHVFNTRAVRQAIHDSASGVKVRHTSPSKIGEVTVRYPASLSKQKEVVSAINLVSVEAVNLESIYRNKLLALEELKKSLLHQAFSGKL